MILQLFVIDAEILRIGPQSLKQFDIHFHQVCLWMQDYIPVEQEELRDYVKARLKVFYEEELDVPLVLFNEVLDHVLRIDR